MDTPEQSIEQQLYNVASEAVYLKSDVIKFLLTENLALKSLLHEKGVLTPEEFQKHKLQAVQILESSMKGKIAQALRQTIEKLKENESAAS